MELEVLLLMIERLYEAGSRPELWPEAVAALGRLYGVASVSLQARNARGELVMAPIRPEADPEADAAYMAHYWKLDPWVAGWSQRPIDGVFLGTDLVDPEELRRTEFYAGFAKPQGAFHFLGASVKVGGAAQLMLGLHRPEHHAAFAPVERQALERLVPHLVRAMQVTLTLQRAEAVRDAMGGALDGLDLGVVLLDAEGRTVFANRMAERLAAGGDGLRLRREGVAARDAREDGRLQRAIRGVLTGEGGPPAPLPVSRRAGPALSVLVAAVGGLRGADAAAWPRGVAAMVLVHDPGRALPSPGAAMAAMHGLTAAEARLLDALVAGDSPGEYAERHRVTRNTVKTQLAQLFAKTGTRRQAELVRMALVNPLLMVRVRE